MSRVVLENVRKNYGAPEDAVKGVSFTVAEGEFVVMLGPSGCGKTTTLRMITGLESITAGTITIGDQVVNNLRPQERNVAMAFETYALYPPLTVFDNIAFPLHVMKLAKDEVKRRVLRVADMLSITDILNAYPDNLAGGQKQRVSLARALVREPTVFLMDEPLSHVDADVRHHARATIKHLQTTTNATVIYVTHDQIEAVALADRVVVMDMGVIQQIGTPLELNYKPANLFVAGFIGEPPMNTAECRLTLDGGGLCLGWPSGKFALRYDAAALPPASLTALHAYHGKNVVIGVRPQRLEIGAADGQTDGALPGTLLVHEFLGKHGISQVDVGGLVWECVTPPEIPFDAGDTVQLTAAFADLSFFDPATTNRIQGV